MLDFSAFKLLKHPKKADPRNFRFAVLRKPVALPAAYDVDKRIPGLTNPMFANDRYGCCVIAERAHQTRRFEYVETKKLITITDKEVTAEYFRQSGGADSGLVMLDSLKAWRSRGWTAARQNLKIRAFAELAGQDLARQVRQTIYTDCGLDAGLWLPVSAQAEIATKKPWSKTTGPGSSPGSWGGHCVLIVAYDQTYLTCITWAQRQKMTWRFFAKYCDESYGVIDAATTAKRRRSLDLALLRELLEEHDAPVDHRMAA